MGLDVVMQAQVKEFRKKRGIINRMKNFVEGFDS